MIAIADATHDLLQVLWSSLVASAAVAFVFALAVFGAIRASELRRSGRSHASAAFALLAACGLVAFGACLVYGLILVGQKS